MGEPEVIHTSNEVIFFVSFKELLLTKSQKLIEYDLIIMPKDFEIYSKYMIGNVNSLNPNPHKIMFDNKQLDTTNLVLSTLMDIYYQKEILL